MRSAKEFCAARESVFDKINPLLNFCANPAGPVLKVVQPCLKAQKEAAASCLLFESTDISCS